MNRIDHGRRRTLKIFAAVGAIGAAGFGRASQIPDSSYFWRGRALGAEASLSLHGVDEARGRQIMGRVGAEIERLERLFSLYREDSDISLLNTRGTLPNPSFDFLRLLTESRAVSVATEGAFDVTVQPLWNAYAHHFWRENGNDSGPSEETIESARDRVNYEMIEFDVNHVRFRQHGMAITFNGIAQGYITDRVVDLLKEEGMHNVLVNLGEIRAIDGHPSGRPWIVGLQDAGNSRVTDFNLEVENNSVATSSGAGTSFGKSGKHHHIFDPRSGRSSGNYRRLSIIGPRATLADALSTGLYNLESARAQTALGKFPQYSANVVLSDLSHQTWSGRT